MPTQPCNGYALPAHLSNGLPQISVELNEYAKGFIVELHTCLAPFYLATEMKLKRQPVCNSVIIIFCTSCGGHLGLSVPIPLFGV